MITINWHNVSQSEWTPDLKQLFCAKPPADICPFGPCANADVTGYGQQASVYLTEVLFSFLLAFWPTKIQTTIYAHNVLILSLQITALLALLRGQLTQNDGIFTLVLVASPTSVYLWLATIKYIANRKIFHRETPGLSKTAAALNLLTLGLEISLVLLMYIPSASINFSQPKCFPPWGRQAILEVLWPIPLLTQSVFFVIVVGFYFLIFEVLERPSQHQGHLDVITWMEYSINSMLKRCTLLKSGSPPAEATEEALPEPRRSSSQFLGPYRESPEPQIQDSESHPHERLNRNSPLSEASDSEPLPPETSEHVSPPLEPPLPHPLPLELPSREAPDLKALHRESSQPGILYPASPFSENPRKEVVDRTLLEESCRPSAEGTLLEEQLRLSNPSGPSERTLRDEPPHEPSEQTPFLDVPHQDPSERVPLYPPRSNNDMQSPDMIKPEPFEKTYPSVLAYCCLAMIQIQPWFIWVPLPGVLAGIHIAIGCFGLVWTFVTRRKIDVEFWIFSWLIVFSTPALVLPILAQSQTSGGLQRPTSYTDTSVTHRWGRILLNYASFAPFVSGFLVAVIGTWSLWSTRNRSKRWQMLAFCFLFLAPLAALKTVQSLLWYFKDIRFTASTRFQKELSFTENLQDLLLGLFTFAGLPWFFVPWLATSLWSSNSTTHVEPENSIELGLSSEQRTPPTAQASGTDYSTVVESEGGEVAVPQSTVVESQNSWKTLWINLEERAHLLKFGLLVVFPNALWISAAMATDFTPPVDAYTIGQMFAILVSVGNALIVIVDFHQQRHTRWRKIIMAIFKSQKIPPTSGLPPSYAKNPYGYGYSTLPLRSY